MKVLCVGDLVGRAGRRVLREMLPVLKSQYGFQVVIVNGENASGGFGLTPDNADEIMKMGVDVITTGNHVWDKKETLPWLDKTDRVLRPLNYPPGVPGIGWTVIRQPGLPSVGVINLQGRTFMAAIDCPFRAAETALTPILTETRVVIVDFHAEATSEKQALGYFLDGRVSLVYGTHTHVQTSDERVLPKGTAYITDVGMTGAHDGIIGMAVESTIGRFISGLPSKFETASGRLCINAVVVDVDDQSGHAIHLERINLPLPLPL